MKTDKTKVRGFVQLQGKEKVTTLLIRHVLSPSLQPALLAST
jgi:hypothetical protein